MEETEKGFWKNIMLPAIGTGGVSTAFNLLTMAVQNKFNSDQAHIARQWNQQMDNSKYQRQVADMKAAGVNPALAMNGGVTTQATSNAVAQGATPAYMNLGAIAQMAQSISAARLNDAQRRNIDEDTNLKKNLGEKAFQETLGVEIDNKYRDEFNDLRNQGQKLANDMTDKRIEEINENINRIKSEIDLNKAKANTEEEKVKLMITEEALNKAKADQIDQLTPYLQRLYSAQTEEAKARAGLMLAQAAWQNGLISKGAIDATVKKLYAEANQADANAIYRMTMHMLGGEQAEIDKMASETSLNNVKKVTAIIDTIAGVLGKLLEGILSGAKAGAVLNLW